MTKDEILNILEDILHCKKSEEGDWIEEYIVNPFGDSKESWRYTVKDDLKICVEQRYLHQTVGEKQDGTLRQFLWNRLHLDRVCQTYEQQYKQWEQLNSGVPYVITNIVSDDEEKSILSNKFIRDFWHCDSEIEKGQSGLRILMAEYGMGKSSFCQGIRITVAGEIESDFKNESASFPFVFDLNEFRNGDFDEFIKNRLSDNYDVDLKFRTFLKLCQMGVFSVVLDAWDQMHDTPYENQTMQDFSQFSALWSENGRVLITCRRSFYQKQLHMKKDKVFSSQSMQEAHLYTLCGFDVNSVLDYFNKANRKLKESGKRLLPIDYEWVKACWKMNSRLMSRPLNLKLLAKHYEVITVKYNLKLETVETFQFLSVILDFWKERNGHIQNSALKTLVMLTLGSGLNRSVSLETYLGKLENSDRDDILQAMKELDFVSIDERRDRIEFRLAAYQEFLWAYFVLEELNRRKMCESDTLLNRYLLLPEVRAWIVRELGEQKSDCLVIQLDKVMYRPKMIVGYSGANALTLLGDLNKVDFYKEQLASQDLSHRQLEGTDLHGRDLTGVNFRGSSLVRANLSYTRLDNAEFDNTNLSEVVLNEYGKLKKCAFLYQDDNPCIVAGTEAGGVLTFSISEQEEKVLSLADETIRDIAADSAGVYTASQDGWVSYIAKNGQLKNAFIANSGVQSIVSGGTRESVYVGANQEGLCRFNWRQSSFQPIEVREGDEPVKVTSVADIHYYTNEYGNYIAYISEDRRQLVFLQLQGEDGGEIIGKGILNKTGLRFGDICFADDKLVYSVIGEGIYYWQVDSLFGTIRQDSLLHNDRRLYKSKYPMELSWAKKSHVLMAVEKSEEYLCSIICIKMDGEDREPVIRAVSWVFEKISFSTKANVIDGFCVSNDGQYMAVAGEKLAVFELNEDIYMLIKEPIEAKISCKDARFIDCTGLKEDRCRMLRERGAKVENTEERIRDK